MAEITTPNTIYKMGDFSIDKIRQSSSDLTIGDGYLLIGGDIDGTPKEQYYFINPNVKIQDTIDKYANPMYKSEYNKNYYKIKEYSSKKSGESYRPSVSIYTLTQPPTDKDNEVICEIERTNDYIITYLRETGAHSTCTTKAGKRKRKTKKNKKRKSKKSKRRRQK